MSDPALLVLRNGLLIDGSGPDPVGEVDIVIEGDRIREVAERIGQVGSAMEVDLKGMTVMPGLIDCHVHANLIEDDLPTLRDAPVSLGAIRAANAMRDTLLRGFTTVRDAGGADWGLKHAIEKGYTPGPRMFIAGRALSQTGGHGDFRERTQDAPCSCGTVLGAFGCVVDGADAMRAAVREELRRGADQIKIMASGGVSGFNERLSAWEFSLAEMQAAVEEAGARGSYVMAHAYSAETVERALLCGVRTIEHGNLVNERVAKLAAEKQAFIVPTLSTYWLPETGCEQAVTPEMAGTLKELLDAGLAAIETCRANGVQLGFGTDLFGSLQRYQGQEFILRREVQPAHEVIASATRVNARIVQQEGVLGEISPGAIADLVVIDGNPLKDISLLSKENGKILKIISGGNFIN